METNSKKLLDQVRDKIRQKHYSIRGERDVISPLYRMDSKR